MGVPAFFRWLSFKYPRIVSECVEHVTYDPITKQEVPTDASGPNPHGVEYDNLYLDMNGIIHPCTHPEDRPTPKTEQEMFEAVFDYIDRIISIVRPRRLLYLAIDGVAPRAKINQQRSRRFLSAQEAERKKLTMTKLKLDWKAAGLEIPEDADEEEEDDDGEEFDSNVITPGTPFMARISVALKSYVARKMQVDDYWKKLNVIFSDASVPGEGEHKIAEFIRVQRAQEGYNPALRHVLYGLDADLIMLGLMTHEVHFTILRELVEFSRRGRNADGNGDNGARQSPENVNGVVDAVDQIGGVKLRSKVGGKKPFVFLDIATLREYLDNEFRTDIQTEQNALVPPRGKPADGFQYNLERVIDDYVFLCFFVGNDFLPRLPTFDIREGALDYLMELYKSHVPRTGYITHDAGEIHFDRMREILKQAAPKETQVFQERVQRERMAEAREKQRAKQEKEKGDNINEKGDIAGQKRVLNEKSGGEPQKIPKLENLIALGGAEKDARAVDHRAAAAAALKRALEKSAAKKTAADSKKKEIPSKGRSEGDSDRNAPMLQSSQSKPTHVDDEGKSEGKKTEAVRTQENEIEQESSERGPSDATKKDHQVVTQVVPTQSGKNEVSKTTGSEDAPDERKASSGKSYEEELKDRLKQGEQNVLLPDDNVRLGEPGWKDRYYQAKFHWAQGDAESKRQLIMSYLEGLAWILKYYYRGCVSWTWYFPYHYAPFASDIVEVKIDYAELEFTMGEPFHPFTQLMGVMPASSGVHVLPKCYSSLMTAPSSPILDYYPKSFKVDLNGKRFVHQGVVLLPFVDEVRLLEALADPFSMLNDKEKQRNSFGDAYIIVHNGSPLGLFLAGLSKEEEKEIPTEIAAGFFFGRVKSKPILETTTGSSAIYHIPAADLHSSELLPNAPRAEIKLDNFHKASAERFGWRTAMFGPLGKEAKQLRYERRQRLYQGGRRKSSQSSQFDKRPVINPPNLARAGTTIPATAYGQNYPYGVYFPNQYQTQALSNSRMPAPYNQPSVPAGMPPNAGVTTSFPHAASSTAVGVSSGLTTNYPQPSVTSGATAPAGMANLYARTPVTAGINLDTSSLGQNLQYLQSTTTSDLQPGMQPYNPSLQTQQADLQSGTIAQPQYNSLPPTALTSVPYPGNASTPQAFPPNQQATGMYNYGMNYSSYSSTGSYGTGGRGLSGPAAAIMRNLSRHSQNGQGK